MALSDPSPRRHIHTRHVTCCGYRRDDGLWDIEGHLTDVKTYGFHTVHRGEIEPGDPVHGMRIRLTITDDFVVTAIEAVIEKSPFDICGGITGAFQQLVGLTIGAGWTRAIKERLAGIKGCTHLTELLAPIATTAFQTIYPVLVRERAAAAAIAAAAAEAEGRKPLPAARPALLDVCHVFDSSGAFVREHWPDHYTGGPTA
jgi:hypothetical protein